MGLNPMGAGNYSWNYSKPDKPGYSDALVGTVLAIQEIQKMGYTMSGQPGAPEFWPDGNPKMNIRLAVCTPEHELKTFTFQPASRAARQGQKASVHMDLFHLTGDTDMLNLIGKTICIQTQPGNYGQGNPRPWHVAMMPDDYGPFELATPLPAEFTVPQVLANSATSGGQMNVPQPAQQQWGQPPMQQQQQWQPPVQQMQQQQWQPQTMQPPVQQPQWNQPQAQQPMPQWGPNYPTVQQPPMQQQPMQPQAQPAQQQYPSEMNRVIADAMQTFGPGVQVQVQPMQSDPVGSGQAYDDDPDMPF